MIALLAANVAGCVFPVPPDRLVQRVAHEFECPPARVNVLERHDTDVAAYDVEACGRRGRYSCVGGGRGGVYGCVHEPDPPKWDPDPTLVASLPTPTASHPVAPVSTGQRRRICGPYDDACLFKQNGAWRWRPAAIAAPTGGCGTLCR